MLRQLLDIARRGKPRKRRTASTANNETGVLSGAEMAGAKIANSSASLSFQPNAGTIPAASAPASNPADISLPFMIRPADNGDLPALAEVFRRSVRELAARDYDAAQLDAWVARADDTDFLSRLAQGTTVLAEHHGEAIGFAQLAPADHIQMLYVRPDWAGLGIATLLCQYLEDEARIAGSRELTTAASHTARRFFESMGYRVEQEESVQLGSVILERSLMRKKLCT